MTVDWRESWHELRDIDWIRQNPVMTRYLITAMRDEILMLTDLLSGNVVREEPVETPKEKGSGRMTVAAHIAYYSTAHERFAADRAAETPFQRFARLQVKMMAETGLEIEPGWKEAAAAPWVGLAEARAEDLPPDPTPETWRTREPLL